MITHIKTIVNGVINDHRDNLLGDGANRRGSCQCGDDGYHDQHSTRGDFKT